jgi:decaprenylphospho-beta-D-erythro-pentofuranosid-2-ulose 2-reductase
VKTNPQFPPVENPLNPKKRAIVLGASSGIGAALVRELARQDCLVAALARREDELQALCREVNAELGETRALAFAHDVRDTERIAELSNEIFSRFGAIDIFVYVAGVQPEMKLDEFDWQKDKEMLAINLGGAIAWLGHMAKFFNNQKHGQIVGISSLAGDRGRVANPVYSSSKAGLDAYLESLRNRLTRNGIHVLTVKPGFVDTVLLANAPRTFGVVSPEKAASKIWQAMRKGKQLIYVPWWWRWIMLAIRMTPSVIFRRLSI